MLWKAIACDFDGTLTDEQGRLSIEALTAARESEARGIPLILSSGRVLAELNMLSKVIGTSGPIIAENGGVIWNPRTLSKHLQGDPEKARRAYQALISHRSEMELLKPVLRETDIVVRGKRAAELQAILRIEELGIHIIDANIATHITDISVDKGRGLKVAAEMLNIDTSEIVAIGDSLNDIALFQAAGAGYAVGNADPCLKALATQVISRSFGAGCADAIRQVLESLH